MVFPSSLAAHIPIPPSPTPIIFHSIILTRSVPMQVLVKRAFFAFIVCNTLLFLALAAHGTLNVEGKSLVFVDFWGRFTVYSLWFIGYLAYRRFVRPVAWLRAVVIALVLANIPLFLLMAYFDKITNSPDTLVFVDFWGRITVYSLWFLLYEAYLEYVVEKDPREPAPRAV